MVRLAAAAAAALAPLACSPSVSQVPPAPAAAKLTEGEIIHALEAAKVGDLTLVDELLLRTPPDSSPASLLSAQKAASLLREEEARHALARYFESGDPDPERRRHAHQLAAGSAFLAGRYAEAAAHAGQLLSSGALPPQAAEGMARLDRIARLLAAAPEQRLETRGSGAPVPISRDKVGLLRAGIATPLASEEAITDTGANLSVASASAARRLGLRMIEGDAAVGNSLGEGVDVRLAIADRLELAGAVLRNVVFLVMDDDALTFPVPGGYSIDAIIGLPVLRALGRIGFGPGETMHLLEPEPERGTSDPSNLRVAGSDLFAVIDVAGRKRPFFFDTGANRSTIGARLAAEHPELAGTPVEEARRAGAGGSTRVSNNRIEQVPLRIGGIAGTAPEMRVEIQAAPGEEDRYGVLGIDLLRAFESFAIDFTTMRLEVGPPLRAE